MPYAYQREAEGETFWYRSDTAVAHSCREGTTCKTWIVWWDEGEL